MAYATIAGLDPVYGLYTAIVTCAVSALLGSSNHLATGPTNAACMVILSLTDHLRHKYQMDAIDIVLLLTVINGLIQPDEGVDFLLGELLEGDKGLSQVVAMCADPKKMQGRRR